ncbi:MAG: hypothetical protein ABFR53_12815, partial [Actinomycetota bacterium]
HCRDDGVVRPPPIDDEPPPPEAESPRYVYLDIDPVVGECHYWSTIPGGLDSHDSRNDAAIIAATMLPICPSAPVAPTDATGRAWEVFRSWYLASPEPAPQPAARGITGLPTFLSSLEPAAITHFETLPDGRPLNVRARITELRIDWGDGTTGSYDPSTALVYPNGSVTHTYVMKTCPADYRANHPSGGLCHPTLEHYTITAAYRWIGEYNSGSGWVSLSSLDRTASLAYDVDEVRGVPIP